METSCGFILINYDSILLLQYPQGHWSFPKGHIEEGDSDHFATARRELLEETGISEVSIIEGWMSKTEYSFFSCLLYTSPSPRDTEVSRMPSSA